MEVEFNLSDKILIRNNVRPEVPDRHLDVEDVKEFIKRLKNGIYEDFKSVGLHWENSELHFKIQKKIDKLVGPKLLK